MDAENPVLGKIEIQVGLNTIQSEVCITPTTIQIIVRMDCHCHYSLFVTWVALPHPLSSKYAVYEEFSFNSLLDELDGYMEYEMHIARECVTPIQVKKWLETWISIFPYERTIS